MALTTENFRALPDRRAAFTLLATNLRWRLGVITTRLTGWLDAGRDHRPAAEQAHRRDGLLSEARELRADLDLLIAELEASTAQADREAA